MSEIIIHNRLEKYIPNPQDYEYKVEFLYQSKWFLIEDAEIKAEATPSFTFVWDEIDANNTIRFRFTAEEQLIVSSPYGIWFMLGGIMAGVSIFFYGIYANFKGIWGISKPKAILYGAIVGGLGFLGGIGVGYFLAPPII